jgi:hypothetical protein
MTVFFGNFENTLVEIWMKCHFYPLKYCYFLLQYFGVYFSSIISAMVAARNSGSDMAQIVKLTWVELALSR